MELQRLEEILQETADQIEGGHGAWEFELDDVRLACLTDEHFDRMRIIAPIIETSDMSDEERAAILEANFHTALDARYATSDGVVYAAFLHPLSSLTEDELRSGLSQVVNLVQTYGSSYSGGDVVFGTPNGGSQSTLN